MRLFAVTVFMAAVVTLTVSGCGPAADGRVGVSGNVTHRGEPLPSGNIQFVAVDGSQMAGAAIVNGSYALAPEQGVFPGEFTVRVSAASEDTAVPVPVEGEAPGDPSLFAPRQELIPDEYNARSTLSTQITSDRPNTYDVEIP